MPAGMSAGQPSYTRGPTSILRHYRAPNIVQRLGHRALTGRGLGITVHQHYGYRMHFQLGGAFGSHTFERRFPTYETCRELCVDIARGLLEGLCNCVLQREYLDVFGSAEYARRYDYLCVGAILNITLARHTVWSLRGALWLDEMRLGPWPAVDEDDGLPRRDEDSAWCRCVVTSSEGLLPSSYQRALINSLF